MLCGMGLWPLFRRGWRGCRQLRQLRLRRGREDLAVTIVGALGPARYPGRAKAHAYPVIGFRRVPETEPLGGTPEIIIGEIVRITALHYQDGQLAPLASLVQDESDAAVRAPCIPARKAALEHRFAGLKPPYQFVRRHLRESAHAARQDQRAERRNARSPRRWAERRAHGKPCSQRRAHKPLPIRRALDSALSYSTEARVPARPIPASRAASAMSSPVAVKHR
jgi:hypothetical protein